MKRQNLSDMSVKQLVQLFVDLSVQQDMALLSLAQDEVNKLYWKIGLGQPSQNRMALLRKKQPTMLGALVPILPQAIQVQPQKTRF